MIEIDAGLGRGTLDDVYSFITRPPFRSILNLETQTRELLVHGDVNKEFRHCQNHNLIYFDVAWSGIFPPRKEDVYSALGVLKYGTRPLFFHCRHGRERTGFLAAVYRMQVQKWPFEKAYEEWIALGCRWPTSWLWKKELRKYEVIKK